MEHGAVQITFEPGDRVVRRTDRGDIGVVTGCANRMAGEDWVSVQFGPRNENVLVEDLARYAGGRDVAGLLDGACFGSHRDLARSLTMSQLRRPLREAIYCLEASKTDFYAYQFKPLLKFLTSDRQRILIADEVGLGKTIEAAYILQEQKARHNIDRILIVCPAALRYKWQRELWTRFNERFDIVDAKGFRNIGLVSNPDQPGPRECTQTIVSMQSIRSADMVENLEQRVAPFDLLIVDEAHHCRNSDTKQHHAVRALAGESDSVVFLTATPLHTGTDNLFNLLRLLHPEEFDRLDVFERRLDANQHVVRAEATLRGGTAADIEEAGKLLAGVQATSERDRFLENPLYQRVQETLAVLNPADSSAVVAVREDLSQLNLLSHVLTRTKKRDVHTGAAVRDPKTVRVEMNGVEDLAYQTISAFCFRRFQEEAGDVAARWSIMNLQRQMASSIHATLDHYRQLAGNVDLSEEMEGIEEDSERMIDPASVASSTTKRLIEDPEFREVIAACSQLQLDSPDSKLEELLRLLQDNRKVMIFAFFKRSLRYLEERLTERGIKCTRIDGDVPSKPMDPENDERQKRIDQFRDDPETTVLLSSTVGGEGLDFQFCHTMVNWDLPWNPMEVEQRIGRLDRVGQQAERILIFNFSIPGTIEDRILGRLYMRVGLFEGAIGPLEPILGQEIATLRDQLFDPTLTDEQREQLIDKTGLALQTRLLQEQQLEERSADLIGHDRVFTDQLDRARKLGRYINPQQAQIFVEDFLERRFPQCTPSPFGNAADCYQLTLTGQLRDFVRSQLPVDDRGLQGFLGRAPGQSLRFTYRSDVAMKNGKVELVHVGHPLVRAIVKSYEHGSEQTHSVAAVEVCCNQFPEGDYFFTWATVNEEGLRGGYSLWAEAVTVDRSARLGEEQAEELLHDVVVSGHRWLDFEAPDRDFTRALFEHCQNAIAARVKDRLLRAQSQSEGVVASRLASLEASYHARRAERQRILDTNRERGRVQGTRLAEARLRVLDDEYKQRREEIDRSRTVNIGFSVEGAGYVRVLRPN